MCAWLSVCACACGIVGAGVCACRAHGARAGWRCARAHTRFQIAIGGGGCWVKGEVEGIS